MTPGLAHASRLLRPPRIPRGSGPPFRWILAASALLHGVLLLVLLCAPRHEPVATLDVFRVRVVDASGPAPPAEKAGGRPGTHAAQTRAAVTRAVGVTGEQVESARMGEAAATRPETSSQPQLEAAPPSARPLPQVAPVPEVTPARRSGLPAAALTADGFAEDLTPEETSAARGSAAGAIPAVAAESLDAGFMLVGPLRLDYPEAAQRARKAGRVRLELEIGPDGRVLAVRVLEATPGWGFAQAAADAYEQARFSPPRWQGRPVRVLWRKTLLFQP